MASHLISQNKLPVDHTDVPHGSTTYTWYTSRVYCELCREHLATFNPWLILPRPLHTVHLFYWDKVTIHTLTIIRNWIQAIYCFFFHLLFLEENGYEVAKCVLKNNQFCVYSCLNDENELLGRTDESYFDVTVREALYWTYIPTSFKPKYIIHVLSL